MIPEDRCTDCKRPLGAIHLPHCHRQGTVSSMSVYIKQEAVVTTPASPEEWPRGRRREIIGSHGEKITLVDDSCRIWFFVEGFQNIDPTEAILWAEYKRCDVVSVGIDIADLLMTGELKRT